MFPDIPVTIIRHAARLCCCWGGGGRGWQLGVNCQLAHDCKTVVCCGGFGQSGMNLQLPLCKT